MTCAKRWTVNEGATTTVLAQLLDLRGDPIDLAAIQAIEATLYEWRTRDIINGRDKQDVLGAAGGALLAPPAIAHVSLSNPVVVTTEDDHHLAPGMIVHIDDLVGPESLNDLVYRVRRISPTKFALFNVYGQGLAEYESGGTLRTGLFALELSPEDNALVTNVCLGEAEEHRLVLEVEYGEGRLPLPPILIDVVRIRP